MTPGCSTCGYEVEVVRSCFRSRWRLFRGRPDITTDGVYISAPEDTPAYPGWHNLWSRDWISDQLTGGQLGEDPDAVRRYHSGAPLGWVPAPRVLGSADCIRDGERWPLEVVPTLVGGFPVGCAEVGPTPREALHVLDPRNWCYWAQRVRQCYTDPIGCRNQLATDYGVAPVGVSVLSDNGLSPSYAILAADPPHPWIVVIAGTTNTLQWIAHIRYGLVPPTNYGTYSTHPVWQGVTQSLLDVMLALGPDPSQPIVIVGHSYGSAVAAILAAKLRQFAPQRQIQLYLLASPRPGDSRLRDIVATCDVVSIATIEDIVPSVPLTSRESAALASLITPLPPLPPAADWTAAPNRVTVAQDGTIQEGALAPGPPDARLALVLWSLGVAPAPDFGPHLPGEYVARLCNTPAAANAQVLWSDIPMSLAAASFSPEEAPMPAGAIIAFGGTVPPDGYLACDGSALDEGEYPDLFAAIGHVWDESRGQDAPASGFFRLPLLNGLVLLGAGLETGEPLTDERAVGEIGGEQDHLLTVDELPEHTHDVVDPQHQHGIGNGTAFVEAAGDVITAAAGEDVEIGSPTANTDPAETGVTLDEAGGGVAHPIMQPFATILWCIKT